MTNIRNLRMGDSLCADARVGMTRGFLGLTTRYHYTKTGSRLEGRAMELGLECGRRLLSLLKSHPTPETVGDFRLQEADYGQYLLEAVHSDDGAFVALYLLQYQQLNYEPVTQVLVFEGEEARALAAIFAS